MKKILLSIAISIFAVVALTNKAFADSTVVVHPEDMSTSFADVISNPDSWFFYNDENDTIDNSLGSFVNGPSTAPLGVGSVQISVSGTQRRNLATYQFSGQVLSEITDLKYSTYNTSAGNGGSVNRSGYINFNVDFNGTDTWQRRLIFLPTDNGTVMQDTWQEWDAINSGNALWRYSGSIWPGTAISGTTPRTWNDILSSYPGVRVRVTDSWFGIRVGEPYADGYTENIDAIKIGTASGITTFDFEPFVRSAEILKPTVGQKVSGNVSFDAVLHDKDKDDSVQWAVRAGTCAAGTGTVFGNVDGFNDPFTWDGETFNAVADTSTWTPGSYCFVFNPTESQGDDPIRLTREFIVKAVRPHDKDDCKKDGWKDYEGRYKNQGQCVSDYEHEREHEKEKDRDKNRRR